MGINWTEFYSKLLEQVWNFVWALDFDDPTDPFVLAFQILIMVIGAIKLAPHIFDRITRD